MFDLRTRGEDTLSGEVRKGKEFFVAPVRFHCSENFIHQMTNDGGNVEEWVWSDLRAAR